MNRSTMLAVPLLILATVCRAGPDWVAQEYTMADGDLGVPTTWWGGPKYARGRLGVLLFIVEPIHHQECRRPMELQRAFDFDVQYVHITDYRQQGDNERARELLDGRRWDCIVVWNRQEWNRTWDWPSDDVKFRVLEQVGEGAGLVITDRAPKEILRDDRRVEPPVRSLLGGLALTGRFARDAEHWQTRYKGQKPASEEAFRKGFFDTFRIGKGRAVRYAAKLTFGGHWSKLKFAREWTWDYRTDPDYGLAELGRAILWAAGREPEVEFAAEPPARLTTPWGATQGQALRWTLAVAGPKRTLTVRSQIRDLAGHVLHRDAKEYPDAAGEVAYSLDLPRLGAGRYTVDLFVDSPRGRETYGYSAIEVQAPITVALNGLPDAVEEGQPVTGTATFAGTVDGVAQAVVRFVDNSDRVVARVVKPAAERIPFSFPTGPACSLQMRVEAEAVAGGISAGRAWKSVNLLRRRQDRFTVVLWGAPGGVWAHYGRRMLWRTGVTHIMAWGGEDAELGTVPFTMAWGFQGEVAGTKFSGFSNPVDPKTKVMKPCCWHDDANADAYVGAADGVFAKGKQHPVLVYNMRDEGPVTGCCLHPACLRAYRTWLKEQYKGSLDALNREWGSAYKSWDAVGVMAEGDVYEAEARKNGHYARWNDRQHFASVSFARGILARQPRLFAKHDPKLRTGFEGSSRFGMDFDAVVAATGFWCPYDGLQTEMIRSIRPPGYIYSYWIGYQKEAAPLIGRTWRMVFNGAPSVWWWMCKGRGRFHGWLAPNMAPYPENRTFLDEVILPLRRGLGDLLIRLDRPHDGIALYYSVAACNAGQLAEAADFNSVQGSHAGFVRLIEDCGFQWVYTTKPRLLAGDLAKRGIRLLILPFHQALGDDETAELRTFVEGGGTVLADLRPGVFSGHLRPLDHGPADALFGIERTGKGKAAPVEGKLTASLEGRDVPIVLSNNRSDAQIRPATAKAAGTLAGAPVFLVNAVGKGRTVLLNFHVTQYSGQREMAGGREARDLFRAFASALGLKPRLERLAPEGELLRTETVTWTKGGVTLYGLLRDGGAAGPASVRLPAKMHVFDLRQGAQGLTERVVIPVLKPGHAALIAAYPYDPGRPIISRSAAQARPGDAVTFRIAMMGVPEAEKGTFSYQTELVDPAGRVADWLPWCAFGQGGRVAVPVQFAYNDRPGRWTLRVREVTTGRSGEGTVVLK